MTGPSVLGAALALLLPLVASAAPEAGVAREPGLWEMKMQTRGAPAGLTILECTDAQTDARLRERAMAQAAPGEEGATKCESRGIERSAQRQVVDYRCQGPRGTTEGRMVLQGDMRRSYTMENTARFDPPLHGQTEARMVVEAAWKGACPADMKPGDRRMDGLPGGQGRPGRTVTPEQARKMQEMMEKMRKAQESSR